MTLAKPIKHPKKPTFQLRCENCGTQLDLGEFLRNDIRKYYDVWGFLMEHQSHQVILVRLEPTEDLEPEKEYPYSHLDLSTPTNRETWKRVTRILLNALVEEENRRKKSGNPPTTSE